MTNYKKDTIRLYVNPRCTTFGFIIKRKILATIIPFAAVMLLHTPVQMLLFWTTKIETPFLTAPLFMFAFFMFCSPVLNYNIEHNYGVTRTRNFLSSYFVAAVYSVFAALFSLGLAVLCNFFKYSRIADLSILIRSDEMAVNFFYGLTTCLLMYPLSDIFFLFRHSGRLFAVILCGILMLLLPLVCTGIPHGGFFEFTELIYERLYALIAYLICLAAACVIDYILLRGGIK